MDDDLSCNSSIGVEPVNELQANLTQYFAQPGAPCQDECAVLLHPDYYGELKRGQLNAANYARNRFPLLVDLALGNTSTVEQHRRGAWDAGRPLRLNGRVVIPGAGAADKPTAALASRATPHAHADGPAAPESPATCFETPGASAATLTPEMAAGLAQASVRALCGRTADERVGTLDMQSSALGPVWDVHATRRFFREQRDLVGKLSAAVSDACEKLEQVVPTAMVEPYRRRQESVARASSSLHSPTRAAGLHYPLRPADIATGDVASPLLGTGSPTREQLLGKGSREAFREAFPMLPEDAAPPDSAQQATSSTAAVPEGTTTPAGLTNNTSDLSVKSVLVTTPSWTSPGSLEDPQAGGNPASGAPTGAQASASAASSPGNPPGAGAAAQAASPVGAAKNRCPVEWLEDLPAYLSRQCSVIRNATVVLESLLVAVVLENSLDVFSADPNGMDDGLTTPLDDGDDSSSGDNGSIGVASRPASALAAADADGGAKTHADSSFTSGDKTSPGARQGALEFAVERVTQTFVKLFLSITTVQHQLTRYSRHHERHHGLCVASTGTTALRSQRSASENASAASSPGGLLCRADTDVATTTAGVGQVGGPSGTSTLLNAPHGPAKDCELCQCFFYVEKEMTQRVDENLRLLKLSAIAIAAHDTDIAEAAINYIDSKGIVFTAQATMLLAHVLTPELLMAHPTNSRGGDALKWILSFVFGGCSSADVARTRELRRMRRMDTNPFSINNSSTSGSVRSGSGSGSSGGSGASDDSDPLSCDGGNSRDNAKGEGPKRRGGTHVRHGSNSDGGGGQGPGGRNLYDFSFASSGGQSSESAPSVVNAAEDQPDTYDGIGLRVEYILGACFTRCHPLMTVIGIVAESDAYGCGVVVAKAVVQYAVTLSFTSARLLRTPLMTTRWTTPFTEAMMRGLNELAKLSDDTPQREALSPLSPGSARRALESSSSTESEDSETYEQVVPCFNESSLRRDRVSHYMFFPPPEALNAAPATGSAERAASSPVGTGASSPSSSDGRSSPRQPCPQGSPTSAGALGELGDGRSPVLTGEGQERQRALRRAGGAGHKADGRKSHSRLNTKGAGSVKQAMVTLGALLRPQSTVQSPNTCGANDGAFPSASGSHNGSMLALPRGLPPVMRLPPLTRVYMERRRHRFRPVRTTVVTGLTAADEAETATNRTYRRNIALHWGKCVILSARTLVRSGLSKVPIPHEHYDTLFGQSKTLQQLLLDWIQRETHLHSAKSAPSDAPPADLASATPFAELQRQEGMPPTARENVVELFDQLVTLGSRPSNSDTNSTVNESDLWKSARMSPTRSQTGSPTFSAAPSMNASVTAANAAAAAAAMAAARGGAGGGGGGGTQPNSISASFVAPPLYSFAAGGGSSSFAQPSLPPVGPLSPKTLMRVNRDVKNEGYERAFADSFCRGRSTVGLFADSPYVNVPIHEVLFAAFYNIFAAVGDVLLSENPRLNSTFINELVSLMYEVRLSMLEARTRVELLTSPSQRFRSLAQRDEAMKNAELSSHELLFPAEYGILLNSAMRCPDIVERWRVDMAKDNNHPAAGYASLLSHLVRKLERYEAPSDQELLISRATLRLLLGVTARDESGGLHGNMLHVDDLDVEGTRKEEIAPRLGVTASMDALRGSHDDLNYLLSTHNIDVGVYRMSAQSNIASEVQSAASSDSDVDDQPEANDNKRSEAGDHSEAAVEHLDHKESPPAEASHSPAHQQEGCTATLEKGRVAVPRTPSASKSQQWRRVWLSTINDGDSHFISQSLGASPVHHHDEFPCKDSAHHVSAPAPHNASAETPSDASADASAAVDMEAVLHPGAEASAPALGAQLSPQSLGIGSARSGLPGGSAAPYSVSDGGTPQSAALSAAGIQFPRERPMCRPRRWAHSIKVIGTAEDMVAIRTRAPAAWGIPSPAELLEKSGPVALATTDPQLCSVLASEAAKEKADGADASDALDSTVSSSSSSSSGDDDVAVSPPQTSASCSNSNNNADEEDMGKAADATAAGEPAPERTAPSEPASYPTTDPMYILQVYHDGAPSARAEEDEGQAPACEEEGTEIGQEPSSEEAARPGVEPLPHGGPARTGGTTSSPFTSPADQPLDSRGSVSPSSSASGSSLSTPDSSTSFLSAAAYDELAGAATAPPSPPLEPIEDDADALPRRHPHPLTAVADALRGVAAHAHLPGAHPASRAEAPQAAAANAECVAPGPVAAPAAQSEQPPARRYFPHAAATAAAASAGSLREQWNLRRFDPNRPPTWSPPPQRLAANQPAPAPTVSDDLSSTATMPPEDSRFEVENDIGSRTSGSPHSPLSSNDGEPASGTDDRGSEKGSAGRGSSTSAFSGPAGGSAGARALDASQRTASSAGANDSDDEPPRQPLTNASFDLSKMPNTRRLIESFAFGAPGGNRSFSFFTGTNTLHDSDPVTEPTRLPSAKSEMMTSAPWRMPDARESGVARATAVTLGGSSAPVLAAERDRTAANVNPDDSPSGSHAATGEAISSDDDAAAPLSSKTRSAAAAIARDGERDHRSDAPNGAYVGNSRGYAGLYASGTPASYEALPSKTNSEGGSPGTEETAGIAGDPAARLLLPKEPSMTLTPPSPEGTVSPQVAVSPPTPGSFPDGASSPAMSPCTSTPLSYQASDGGSPAPFTGEHPPARHFLSSGKLRGRTGLAARVSFGCRPPGPSQTPSGGTYPPRTSATAGGRSHEAYGVDRASPPPAESVSASAAQRGVTAREDKTGSVSAPTVAALHHLSDPNKATGAVGSDGNCSDHSAVST